MMSDYKLFPLADGKASHRKSYWAWKFEQDMKDELNKKEDEDREDDNE